MNDASLPLADRGSAGRALAPLVAALQLPPPLLVLALPRGGVPVAAEVAHALGAPLDVLLVRKIGAPYQRELAVAAVVESDTGPLMVIDDETARDSGAGRDWIEAQAAVEWREIERRQTLYRQGRAAPAVTGTTVIVVDDGIATGTTVRAALKALRRRGAARIVLAVPVAPADTLAQLRREADHIVCLAVPSPFVAIGCHYEDFHQLSDEEVLSGLSSRRAR
jgi:putative phosphoribosyl transferase